MSNVKVTLSATQIPVPLGVTFASVKLELTDSAGVTQTHNIDGSGSVSSVFENVADGDGVVVAAAVDTLGNTIGEAFSAQFTAPIVVAPAMFPQVTALSFDAA